MTINRNNLALILLFLVSEYVLAGSSIFGQTIYGYFENENARNKLVCGDIRTDAPKYSLDFECIFFLKDKTKNWTIHNNNNCTYFNLYQGEHAGEIITECANRIEERFFYYLFDKKHTNWFLYKIYYSQAALGPDDDTQPIYTHPIDQWSIDKELLKLKNVTTLPQLVTAVEKKYKKKKYTEISAIAKTYPFTASDLTNQTVLNYNNLAFYYQQAGAYKQAIVILSDIVKQFPNRTVAYLNLGDAYLGQGNKQKARHYHQLYITQMKAQGKENLIPERLHQNMASFK